MADITCQDVRFDENGDPAELIECKGAWIRVPQNNPLTRKSNERIWYGSGSRWFWKSDGERYCCPGMWLQAPEGV